MVDDGKRKKFKIDMNGVKEMKVNISVTIMPFGDMEIRIRPIEEKRERIEKHNERKIVYSPSINTALNSFKLNFEGNNTHYSVPESTG